MHYLLGDKLISDYFFSWQNHDIDLLRNIFLKDAVYEIVCLNRKYIGIDEIIGYWSRNAIRQREVVLNYRIINTLSNRITVKFIASFFDNEENQIQEINGLILFVLKNNKIANLKENYTKTILG